MHRIVPEIIIENYRAGRHAGSFKAASMFLDISGFSTMTDALMGQGRDGAETLAVMMRAVFDPLVEAVFEQRGLIAGYAGDSISALFVVDAGERAAALRALAAAHAIQRRLATQSLFETPYGTFRISAKIGLATGAVSWGILRSRKGSRAAYYFRGDAVEGAAGAEHQALAGDIILNGEIREQLGSVVETEPIARFHSLLAVMGDLPAGQPVALPPVDAAAAAVFVPRELVDRDLRGEFRQTAALFLQIPDLPDDQLQQFMFTCFDLQSHYGGLIDRIDFGDKGCILIISWGAPVAHENDIDRALSFVLDLRTRLDVSIRAGITYYISYAGYVGGQLYETYTPYGWGMNLAARLMMAAGENDTWVDERIFQRGKQRFHLEFAGEQSFKGFAQKQKVYRLLGRKSGAAALFEGRLAGRAAELQALAGCIQPLWDGKYAGAIGVWGEAGIGKSRLVHEFRQSLAAQGRSCLWAFCPSDEILQGSFQPFRHWLMRYFEILPAQENAARLEKFLSKLDELMAATGRTPLSSELKRLRGFLASLVGVQWQNALSDQMDAQARYDNTIIALICLLKAESLRQPLILFLEDGQHLDEDSKALVARLDRALAADPVSYPIAILLAARWQGGKVLLEDGLIDHEIQLTGLPHDSVASLCADLLGGPAAPAVTDLINERTEGNPFFAEQTLRYLQEQDLLEQDREGEWGLKPPRKSTVLPMDVRAMLVARIDQMAAPVKDVIQAASVLGRVFDVPVLHRMLPAGSSLHSEIAAAEQASIWSALSETRYIFNHALLRDVAYTMQLQSRRRLLHALAYEALRDSFGSDLPRHYPELAYHCEQAALADEARRYLELAGDAARDEYQNVQALDFYRRALALLPATALREQYRLHGECEKILIERGTVQQRADEIEAMQALAETTRDPGNVAEVTLLRARLARTCGEYDRAAELADQARALALQARHFDVAIDAYQRMVDAYYTTGRYKEAVECSEAALTLARQQDAVQAQAEILNRQGLAVLAMQNPSAARAHFEQSLSMFRAQQNVRGVADVLANLGIVAGFQGNYSTALDYYEQALRVNREIGSRQDESPILGNLGWTCGLLGDFQKAKDYAAQSVQIARELGSRESETFALINLSSYAGAMGEYAAAIDYAEQGLALARQSRDRNAEAWALTYLGHGLFDSGKLGPARDAYQEALELRYELDQPLLATEPGAGLARIRLIQGDPAAAQDLATSILSQLEQDGTLEGTDQPLRVYLNSYLILSELNDQRANGLLNTAHDMLKTRSNGIADPSARQAFLENIPYNRAIVSLWKQRHEGEPPPAKF